jgi:hypothetical protein
MLQGYHHDIFRHAGDDTVDQPRVSLFTQVPDNVRVNLVIGFEKPLHNRLDVEH